jgi:hypothetical protein
LTIIRISTEGFMLLEVDVPPTPLAGTVDERHESGG